MTLYNYDFQASNLEGLMIPDSCTPNVSFHKIRQCHTKVNQKCTPNPPFLKTMLYSSKPKKIYNWDCRVMQSGLLIFIRAENM